MDANDPNLRRMIMGNLEMANKHHDITKRMSDEEYKKWKQNVFEMYHVVWGVWNTAEKGFDMFPLKGDAILRATMDASPPVELKMTAILCTEEEGKQAILAARPNERTSPV